MNALHIEPIETLVESSAPELGILRGTVQDGASGVAGLDVRVLFDGAQSDVLLGHTDANGEFRVVTIEPSRRVDGARERRPLL